jgi:uncharacterized membrane protein
MSKQTFYILIAMIILSGVGIADSLYLTLTHGEQVLFCDINEGCDVVLKSDYAEFLGLPTAAYGVLYYALVFALVLVALGKGSARSIRVTGMFPIVGVLVSLGLIFLQAVVIGEWCKYCLLSAFTSFSLCILGIALIREDNVKTQHEGTE